MNSPDLRALLNPAMRRGLDQRIQSLKRAGSLPVSLAACAVLDFADKLREARGDAQRALRAPGGRPSRAAVTAFLTARFTAAPGLHGSGYVATRTANDGRRWHFSCGRCGRPTQRLFRPLGWTTWACRWCSGVGRPRFDRGGRWAETFWLLVRELEAASKRRGPRPRRYHTLVRRLRGMVAAGYQRLA